MKDSPVTGGDEFEMDGTIANANSNFLNVMGYSLDKIQGRHHSIFVSETIAEARNTLSFG